MYRKRARSLRSRWRWCRRNAENVCDKTSGKVLSPIKTKEAPVGAALYLLDSMQFLRCLFYVFLFCTDLRVKVDDFGGHFFHDHAGHDVILSMSDEDIERIL